MQSSRKQILVAECDPIVLAVINYLLARQGHHVEAFDCGEKAAASLRVKRFDLAVICWQLSGSEWMQSLFADVPALRGRVVLTGAPGESADLPLLAALPKPIDFTLMVETVRRALDELPD